MNIYNINSDGSLQVIVANIDYAVTGDVMASLREGSQAYNLVASEIAYEHPYYDFETKTIKERSDRELLEARLKSQPAFTKLDGDTLVPVIQKSKYHEWDYNKNVQVFNTDAAKADCYARLKARLEYVLTTGFSFVTADKVVIQPVRMSDIDKLKIYINRIGDSSNVWYFDNKVALILTTDQAKALLSKMENAYSVVNQAYFFIKGYITMGQEVYLTKFEETYLDTDVSYLNEGLTK